MTGKVYLVFLSFFFAAFLLGKVSVSNQQSVKEDPNPAVEGTNTFNQGPTERPSIGAKNTQTGALTAKTPTPIPDPDPVVTCNFKTLGSKRIKSSECSKSFECQVGGNWYIYTSRDKCTSDQKAYWTNLYPNGVYVYPSPSTFTYNTYYSPYTTPYSTPYTSPYTTPYTSPFCPGCDTPKPTPNYEGTIVY